MKQVSVCVNHLTIVDFNKPYLLLFTSNKTYLLIFLFSPCLKFYLRYI